MANAIERTLKQWEMGLYDWSSFLLLAQDMPCVKSAVIDLYKSGKTDDTDEERKNRLKDFNSNNKNSIYQAANWVWLNKQSDAISAVNTCNQKQKALKSQTNTNTNSTNGPAIPDVGLSEPFDRRLSRLEVINIEKEPGKLGTVMPFSSAYAEVTTSGYIISPNAIKNSGVKDKQKILAQTAEQTSKMKKDEFYYGVPALQNQYAILRLYNAQGGKYLINKKGERRWYEVDTNIDNQLNFTSTPTTSALISWGNNDPYGRTPYQFTDFVFSKYWNKITNNRLITLRRYAAPILDNLKFPGMSGQTDTGSSDAGGVDKGSTKGNEIAFPPMASAITYFGGDTGNSLSSILKFTTGVLWDEVQAAVWEPTTSEVPNSESGASGLFGGISKFAEMLNVAGGNFDKDLAMNKGQLPPDPYQDGPYENRIRGPVNRIDAVKKRKPGLDFKWDGLKLVFEYVARPVGGVNPKAVLLDIMSNFLIIGSASAVFFGGAHRFMATPATYPFLGGDKGIEKWYKGDPVGWGLTVVKQFAAGGDESRLGDKKTMAGSGTGAFSNIADSAKNFFNQLFSGEKGSGFGALNSLFTGGTGNIISNVMASKSAGHVPFMTGLKAILTGEPVGEWHVTIGNPLNPIAMIGNLICTGIEVELNEELGPDDFPTEMKITVNLDHAMARDRDAIESIFNRGMGRIYSLPDSFLGSADFQTSVDPATKEPTQTGSMPNRRMGILYRDGMDSGNIPKGQLDGKPLSMGGEISVWQRQSFSLGISENSTTQYITSEKDIFKSVYRTADWIAQRSLK